MPSDDISVRVVSIFNSIPWSDVALECAGFLSGLGFHTGLMIRSSPLKSFDQVIFDLTHSCRYIYSLKNMYSVHAPTLNSHPIAM